jgi:hypothetical protein
MKRRMVPTAKPRTGVIKVAAHKMARGYPVRYVVQLPGGKRVANIARERKLCNLLVKTGIIERQI